MANFTLGIQAALYNLQSVVYSALQFPLFWGFALGFLISTLVHAFLMSEHPAHVPIILMHKTHRSFEKIYGKEADPEGGDLEYELFAKMAMVTKFVFALSVLVFLLVVLWATVR